jgi:voltage-gated potassium channel Kch
MVETARKHFPHLEILARASGRTDAYQLLEAGVDRIYRETLDSSLTLGIDALRLLGFRGYQARRAARTFRRHDEESLRELAALRHDQASYITLTRQKIKDVEAILEAEFKERPADVDAGWDTDALRRDYGSES